MYYADFMMDVLVYTVVLNLFVEYVDEVVIDSFTVSLLTAIVLKLLVDLLQYLVDQAKGYFSQKEGKFAHLALVLSALAVMFFGKIAILVIVAIIFEDDVDLGGFFNVLILVVVMMIGRRASGAVFLRLGARKPPIGNIQGRT
jgi:hypothetical protein